MARTLDQFRTQHDPRTVIARLDKELAETKSQLGMQETIAGILGIQLSDFTKVKAPPWTVRLKDGDSPGVPTLFLSDIHAGEVVDSAQVNGVNSYNLKILAKRMEHTIETAVYLCKLLDGKMRYPGIVIPLGGDMVSGDIHDELVATNELPTIPTVLELYELLVRVINTALLHFPAVFLPCVSGNHGRNTKKTWAKNRNGTSFDWLLYQMLAKSFANESRVTFYIPAGSDGLYRVFNTRYLITHGDQFRGGDSIIGPIGPIFRGTQKKLARNQAVAQDFDVAIMGHWHQYIHTERVIVNGSMKGYDEYAAQGNFGFEPPRQALWVTHPVYGINWRMPVLCEKPKARPSTQSWASVAS
jgi:hypothetical protein